MLTSKLLMLLPALHFNNKKGAYQIYGNLIYRWIELESLLFLDWRKECAKMRNKFYGGDNENKYCCGKGKY